MPGGGHEGKWLPRIEEQGSLASDPRDSHSLKNTEKEYPLS